MKRLATLTAAAALLAAGAVATPATASAAAQPPSVRVMPLGDSITYGQGSCTGGGYRLPLANLVAGQSRYSVDFVGSQQHGAMADPDHEGHPGYRTDQILGGVDGWLAAAHPDVVLLHIGINDLNQGVDQNTAANTAHQLIDRIFADQPGVTVIMQGLIPTTPGWNYQGLSQPIAQYNTQLKQVESAEQAAGKHFTFVDAPALTATNQADSSHPAQMADGLHPNDSGYALLAQNFYTSLDQAYTAGWFTGGAPQASSTSSNTVHLVDLTPDGGLHNTEGNYSAGAWNGWSDMGASGIKEAASAATYSVNHVFAIGNDGYVYEKDGNYATGQWSGWNQVPGSANSKAVTASSYGDMVHLATIGTDGHLHNSDGIFPNGGWNAWTDHGGTGLKHLASATTDGVNHIFAIDSNNQLQELDADYCAGAWGSWAVSAGGFTGQDVTAAAFGNTVHLDAIGMDGSLYNTEGNYGGSGWSGWSNMGGSGLKRLTSATSSATNVNHIFAINSNNRLTEIDADYNTHSWNTWAEPAGGADSIGLTADFTN
ncbi:GDSL-type esterase/lipase family protein [Kitasatospora sp. NBC_01302]|uniref:GDSL-type esterase/lipase family protein n=1 Tax=Kitasatospora sp. NBC_01302 TaxID=2903575 RepID=UPI002E1686F9|nr:SGNH/GDSL hydrolase family protein [Kitasatospora sp. NBC_01302]